MPFTVQSIWSWSGIERSLVYYLKFLRRLLSFLSGSPIYQLLRMPTHCGDPVTSALQQSLLTQRRLKDSSVLNFKLVTNAKQILETPIKYETVSTSCTQPLEKLKAQYKVLSTLGATSSSQLSTSTSSSPPSKPSPAPSSSPSLTSQHGNRSQVEKAPPANGPTVPVPKITLFPSEAVVVGWKSNSVPIGNGFVNLGNTCYLNSTLQALFHVPAFVNWLMSDKAHFTKCEMMNGMTHSECLICAMAKTLQSSHKMAGTAIKPSNIYSKLKLICKHLNPGHQEDAHEFLRYLLEGMERSYLSRFNGNRLDNLSKETTPLGQIFGGYIRTEVTCLECKHISTTFQHFQDLILDIRTASSVEEALEHYFARERLGDDGDHPYKCEQCKRRVAATKKFSLERPPKALCVQLKRFGVLGGKNNKHITIKQWLDMTKFRHRPSISSQLKYKLVAMVNHHGHSSSCGHYTAVGLTSNGNYYLFDDSSVRQMPLSNVLSTNPYILMYELDSIELAKEKDKATNKSSTKVEPPLLTNGATNGSLFKSASADKLKSPLAKSSYGRLSPLKFNMNVKLSQSAPNLSSNHGPLNSSTSSPSLASSSSSITSSSHPQSPPSNSSSSTSSLGKPGTSKTPQKTKTFNSDGPSLVPYLSESSDSESEATPFKPATSATAPTPSQSSPVTTNGWAKSEPKEEESGRNGLPEVTIPQEKRNGETCSRPPVPLGPVKVKVDVEKSWQSTPARTDLPSPAGSVSSGKWSVTSCDKDKSPERPRENSLTQNSTVQSLLRMSHQGYGHTGINSWNGNRSQMDQEIIKDREANKRSRSPLDSMDRGKVKKMKYNNNMNNMNKDRSRNRFQEYQNRNYNWTPRPRTDFYRQYRYKSNKNNNYNSNNNRLNSNNYWRH